MRIGVFCATRRGRLFLEALAELLPSAELVVCSFREEPHEPPFFDDMREWVLAHGGTFFDARRIDGSPITSFMQSSPVDLLLVVSWRYLISPNVYQKPRLGTFVFHDSLLPRSRGFAPTVWSIINGERSTGATLFEIAEEVDSGDIVDQQAVPIGPDDRIGEIMESVTAAYRELLKRNLPALMQGAAPRRRQDHAQATYTRKRRPADNRIDWSASALAIHNLVRAVTAPYPGAYTELDGKTLRVWSAQCVTQHHRCFAGTPGSVVEVRPNQGAVVVTGDGLLLLREVQLVGGEITSADRILTTPSQPFDSFRIPRQAAVC